MSYIISTATPADSEAINRLYHNTWVFTYPNEELSVSKEDIEDMLKSTLLVETIEAHKKWLSKLPSDIKVLVAKDGESLIGFCYVKRGDDQSNNKLRAIYVSPALQGKGVGTLLWAEAVKFLNPSKETDVELVAYNKSAMHFYERLGFVDTGKRIIDNEDFRLKSGKILPLAYLTRPPIAVLK